MKDNAKAYLILGIVFLAIGITMIMTDTVSRTMAYGDIVIAIVFLRLSTKAGKAPKDDPNDKKDE